VIEKVRASRPTIHFNRLTPSGEISTPDSRQETYNVRRSSTEICAGGGCNRPSPSESRKTSGARSRRNQTQKREAEEMKRTRNFYKVRE